MSVIGTDIDPDSLEIARGGCYEETTFEETPKLFQESYFKKVDQKYEIVKEIGKLVSFRRQDLFHDIHPRFMDLICCRNVIIYFSKDAQMKLMEKFYNSLTTGGYLILGKTETMSNQFSIKFERINSRERVFRKK